MITNAIYKNYCNQIAELFCTDQLNKTLCKTSIAQRLINEFTDDGFSKFLGVLTTGKTYQVEVKNYRLIANSNKRYVDIYFTDVITGNIIKKTWNWSASGNFYQQLSDAFKFYNYNLIQGSNVFDQGNYQQIRIFNNPLEASYGVSFVQGSVPGGSTGNQGNGTGQTPNFQPTQQPVQQTELVKSGFDLNGIFDNPILLIGVGVLAFFILMKK